MTVAPKPPPGGRKGFAVASLVLGILSLPTPGLVGMSALLVIMTIALRPQLNVKNPAASVPAVCTTNGCG